jgi:hypothetical protein
MVADHTPAYFEALLGTPFLLTERDNLPLHLTAVRIARNSTPEHPSFALLFRGPLQPELPQQTYTMETVDAVRRDIFIVPVARDAGGMQYEAVFN